MEKKFGEDSKQVLHVFDDKTSLSILEVTATLQKHMADLMDGKSWMPSSGNIQNTITSVLPSAAATSAAGST